MCRADHGSGREDAVRDRSDDAQARRRSIFFRRNGGQGGARVPPQRSALAVYVAAWSEINGAAAPLALARALLGDQGASAGHRSRHHDDRGAFLGETVLPDKQTVAEYMAPQIEAAYATGQMPKLLPFFGTDGGG